MTKTLKKGFTLVELIVVIAIIAVLSTVSVVGYSAFIKNANQSKVNQELVQVENILKAEAVSGVSTESVTLTLDGSKLVFTFQVTPTQALFDALLVEAEVPANMISNMDLVFSPVATDLSQERHILYQIDDAKAFIVVTVVLPA